MIQKAQLAFLFCNKCLKLWGAVDPGAIKYGIEICAGQKYHTDRCWACSSNTTVEFKILEWQAIEQAFNYIEDTSISILVPKMATRHMCVKVEQKIRQLIQSGIPSKKALDFISRMHSIMCEEQIFQTPEGLFWFMPKTQYRKTVSILFHGLNLL